MTLIAGAATGLGGALVLFKKKLSSNFLAGALGVSAGVMIFISLAELFPEAQNMILGTGMPHGKAMVLVAFFVGMGIITLIDFAVPEYENPHEASGLSLDARTPAVGMLEHAGNESALKRLGIMSALAIAIHNFPEGIATFIGENLLRAKHTDLTVNEVEKLPEGALYTTENRTVQCNSPRVDAVTARVFCLSREDSQALFAKGLVFIDGRQTYSPSKELKVGETVSVRGKGRFIFQGTKSLSKKGKLNLSVEVFT